MQKRLYISVDEEQIKKDQKINLRIDYIITTIDDKQVSLKTVDGINKTDTRIVCLSNQYLRLKAMNGQWFVISGVTTDE